MTSAASLSERLIQAAVDYESGRCSSRELAEARAAVESAIHDVAQPASDSFSVNIVLSHLTQWLDDQIAEASGMQAASYEARKQVQGERWHARQCALYEAKLEIQSCGAELNRHSGAVEMDKRAEQSNPGGGHVTEHDDMKHMDVEKPPADEPTPQAGRLSHSSADNEGDDRWREDSSNEQIAVRMEQTYNVTGDRWFKAAAERLRSADVPQTSGVWQPIETAPKDGTPIEVCNTRHPDAPPVIVRWDDDALSEDLPEPHWVDAATRAGEALYYNQNYFDFWKPTTALPRPKLGGE